MWWRLHLMSWGLNHKRAALWFGSEKRWESMTIWVDVRGTDSGASSDCVQVHRFENIYFNSVKWIIRFLTCSKPSSKIACQSLSEEFWFKGQITHDKSDQASWTVIYICQYPTAAPEPAAATYPTRRNCFMSPFIAIGFQVCGRSDLQQSGLRRRATKLKSGAA